MTSSMAGSVQVTGPVSLLGEAMLGEWRVEKPATTFWHKALVGRIQVVLQTVGLEALYRPGLHGADAADYVLPDLGVLVVRPPERVDCTTLPGSAFALVVEVVDVRRDDGEYTDKLEWYAQRGIPEYWIADQTPDRSDDDALVIIHRLESFGGKAFYECERSLLLSELETEYRAKGAQR